MKHIVLALLFAVGLIHPHSVFAYSSPGIADGYVNDFADMLNDQEEISLEQDLVRFENETSHEIAVVTITSLGGDDIESYSNKLFREWGIGKKDVNNGVLFLIAKQDRRNRIEVGYGLEGALTDSESVYILNEMVRPKFRAGEFSLGVRSGVEKIKEAIVGEIVERRHEKSQGFILSVVSEFISIGWMIMAFIVLQFLAWYFGRSKTWWLGGIVGTVFGVVMLIWVSSWIVVAISTIAGLILDFVVSRHYREYQRSERFSHFLRHNSFKSGGSSGRSGGGGFGGGSSGGGGGSGSW